MIWDDLRNCLPLTTPVESSPEASEATDGFLGENFRSQPQIWGHFLGHPRHPGHPVLTPDQKHCANFLQGEKLGERTEQSDKFDDLDCDMDVFWFQK